ncbi:unnamed protein product [Schistocephalus solidus]|uniref:Integrase catalytic domain-containing protein n=1 Tax=Schistocephalus solidus TaxID=70667 RepID=A0A183SGX2_SCHSO|nr:unnamed protein product [Schistocephalus solidus]
MDTKLMGTEGAAAYLDDIFVNGSTTGATINTVRRLFNRFGCPETLVSDNGGQFTSTAFTRCCKESGINHLRSPPAVQRKL